MSERLAKRVLLIGWDAADWQMIDPLMNAGAMPTLKRLIDSGVRGNISTLSPVLSPILWNSIATGKHGDKHDILGFREPDGQGGVRPVSSSSRKAKAVWNILSQFGISCNIVSWYASYPAERIRGCVVTDRYQHTLASEASTQKFVMDERTIWPAEIIEDLRELRVGINDLTIDQARAFIPAAAELDPKTNPYPAALAEVLSQCATVHNAATYLLEHRPAEFMAVYYDAIDHFGHGFMEFHPPRMDHVTDEQVATFGHVMNSAYQYHDMMLARLLDLAGPETTVLIVSDHGFHSGPTRPKFRFDEQKRKVGPGTNPVAWHRSHGIFVASGPGIRRGAQAVGISLLDIAPTILALFGLPVGADMDGSAAAGIFDRPVKVTRVDSHESEHADDGVHRAEFQDDPYSAQEVFRQLAALGYVESPDQTQEQLLARVLEDRKSNLAQLYFSTGRCREAAALLRELITGTDKPAVYRSRLAMCLIEIREFEEATSVLDGLDAAGARRAATRTLRGQILLKQGRFAEAEAVLSSVLADEPLRNGIHTMIGDAFAGARQWDKSEIAFRRALELNPDDPDAHDGLAIALRFLGKTEDAVFHHMQAAALVHHRPNTHLNLGIALVRMRQYDWARRAFEVAAELAPHSPIPHRCLSKLHSKFLHNSDLAHKHMSEALRLRAALKQRRVTEGMKRDAW